MSELPKGCPIPEFCKDNSGVPDEFILSHFDLLSRDEINNILIPLCMAEAVLNERNNCCPIVPLFLRKVESDPDVWMSSWTIEKFKELGILPDPK